MTRSATSEMIRRALPDARACGRNHRALCHPQARHDRRQPGACRSRGAIAACGAGARCRDGDPFRKRNANGTRARFLPVDLHHGPRARTNCWSRFMCRFRRRRKAGAFGCSTAGRGDFAIVSVAATLRARSGWRGRGLAAGDRRHRPGAGPRRATGGRRSRQVAIEALSKDWPARDRRRGRRRRRDRGQRADPGCVSPASWSRR